MKTITEKKKEVSKQAIVYRLVTSCDAVVELPRVAINIHWTSRKESQLLYCELLQPLWENVYSRKNSLEI